MAAFNFYEQFGYDLGAGFHALQTHVIHARLTNDAPLVDTDALATDAPAIAATGGYADFVCTTTWTETAAGSGIWRLNTTVDPTWTATGVAFVEFRYVVFFNDTQTSPVKPLIGYLDNVTPITLADGSTFTADVGANGLFEFTIPAPT